MTDDELYREYLDGDSSAGDRLMLRYGDVLTAYLDGFLHNAHDAEDLMLDCFAVILVNKPSARGISGLTFSGWPATRQTACGGGGTGSRNSAWTRTCRHREAARRIPSGRMNAAPSCKGA